MRVQIRSDSVTIEGYVNAVERNSKPLMSRIGRFIERIRKGAFSRAIERNPDIHILLNHDWSRDLGSTMKGNLVLNEDNIGLHARAEITDAQVISDARAGNLVGWSFGFYDRDVETKTEDNMPLRLVNDLDLREVSILNKEREPAYEGTLIMARSEDDIQYYGEAFIEDVETEQEEEQMQQEDPDADKRSIDYEKFEIMIAEMKKGAEE